MQNLDPSLVFTDRPKNAKLTRKAKCPSCYAPVRYSEFEDGDITLALNCAYYCEKEEGKWIDNPLCYAKGFMPEVKVAAPKPKQKKKGSWYKKKKKSARHG